MFSLLRGPLWHGLEPRFQFITQPQHPLSPLWLVNHKTFWVLVSVFLCWYNKLHSSQSPFISQLIKLEFWWISPGQNQNFLSGSVGLLAGFTSTHLLDWGPTSSLALIHGHSQLLEATCILWLTINPSRALNLISPPDASLSSSLLWWYHRVLSQGYDPFFLFKNIWICELCPGKLVTYQAYIMWPNRNHTIGSGIM